MEKPLPLHPLNIFPYFRMSTASRKYSVQDVIDAIQNGESDVDIGHDDTDDESDDETYEQVDKENQAPIDCPAVVQV